MIKAEMDTRQVERDLNRLRGDLDKLSDQSVIEMAQLGSRQLAYRIDPYGLDNKSKDTAEKAIYKDVNKAYDYVGQTFNKLMQLDKNMAYAYMNAIKRNDLDAAERYARKVFVSFKVRNTDSGNHLESVRGSDGRVIHNSPVMGISSDSEIDKIKNQKKVTAGTAKAGWLQAGKSIGSKFRIPRWLTKKYTLGYSNKKKTADGMEVTLINNVTYASEVLTESKVREAVKNAYDNQMSKIKRQIAALTKKF